MYIHVLDGRTYLVFACPRCLTMQEVSEHGRMPSCHSSFPWIALMKAICTSGCFKHLLPVVPKTSLISKRIAADPLDSTGSFVPGLQRTYALKATLEPGSRLSLREHCSCPLLVLAAAERLYSPFFFQLLTG